MSCIHLLEGSSHLAIGQYPSEFPKRPTYLTLDCTAYLLARSHRMILKAGIVAECSNSYTWGHDPLFTKLQVTILRAFFGTQTLYCNTVF